MVATPVDTKNEESSGFEVVDKKENNVTPISIKPITNNAVIDDDESISPKKKPNVVGIQAFKTDYANCQEIDSPMKRRKKTLGALNLKSNIVPTQTDDKFKKHKE